jgi:hypothetical protein
MYVNFSPQHAWVVARCRWVCQRTATKIPSKSSLSSDVARWYEQLQAIQLSMLLCFHAILMIILCGRLRLVVMVVVGILVGVLLEDK